MSPVILSISSDELLETLRQKRSEHLHSRRERCSMRAHQLQRRRLTVIPGKQLDQPPGTYVRQHVQPGFVNDPQSVNTPTPNDIGVIAHAVACDLHGLDAIGQMEAPSLVGLLAHHITQAIMPAQIFQGPWCPMSCQVMWRGADRSAISRGKHQ